MIDTGGLSAARPMRSLCVFEQSRAPYNLVDAVVSFGIFFRRKEWGLLHPILKEYP